MDFFWFILELGLLLGGMVTFVSVLALFLVYAERKAAARFQCRVGPMRVGWHGSLQTIADTIKLLTKESPVPDQADRFLFNLAPIIPFAVAFSLLALIPFPFSEPVANLNTGVLFIVAMSSIGVVGLLVAGWSSNSKYSLLGGMRLGAQIVSYELTAALALLTIVLFVGGMGLGEIVRSQEAGWWIWRGHIPAVLAFLMFTIAATAECNRTPFDLAEGESELTAGFHTEYGGIRFAMFFLAEFLNMFVFSALSATLFFGGWLPLAIPGLDLVSGWLAMVPGWLWFLAKTLALVFLMMWFRWTFPRLRIDQLIALEWKFLLPLSLLNLLLTSVVVLLGWYF